MQELNHRVRMRTHRSEHQGCQPLRDYETGSAGPCQRIARGTSRRFPLLFDTECAARSASLDSSPPGRKRAVLWRHLRLKSERPLKNFLSANSAPDSQWPEYSPTLCAAPYFQHGTRLLPISLQKRHCGALEPAPAAVESNPPDRARRQRSPPAALTTEESRLRQQSSRQVTSQNG